MKISEVKIQNFKGIEKGTYVFPASSSGAYALLAANGTGKTSLIEALLWLLAGEEPEGELIRHGSASAAVQITTDDGTVFVKKKSQNRPNRWAVNGNWSSQTVFNAALEAKTGLPIQQIKPLLVGRLMTEAASGNMSDVLLPYLPEQIDRETVIRHLPDGTKDEEADMVRLMLPDGTFGTDELDRLYKKLYDKRAEIKKQLAEAQGFLSAFGEKEVPTESRKDLDQRLQDLVKKRDEAVVYATKAEAWRRAVSARAKQEEMIKTLEKQIRETAVPPVHTDAEAAETAKAKEMAQNAARTAYAALTALIQSANALKSAIKNIQTDVCPLSEKLHCMTDKTAVLSDLKVQLKKDGAAYQVQHGAYKQALEDEKSADRRLSQIQHDMAAAAALDQLKRQKAELEKAMPTVPEQPATGGDVQALDAEMGVVRRKITYLDNAKKAEAVRRQADDLVILRDAMESLCTALSPKGTVKQELTAEYLKAMAASLSEETAKVLPGANVRFEADNGIRLYLDRDGNGTVLPFTALSGGEKAAVLFAIIRMLSASAGTRILILDELSVLDSCTFRSLLARLKDEPMDLALIAAVDHEDTVAAVEEAGIPRIKIK